MGPKDSPVQRKSYQDPGGSYCASGLHFSESVSAFLGQIIAALSIFSNSLAAYCLLFCLNSKFLGEREPKWSRSGPISYDGVGGFT